MSTQDLTELESFEMFKALSDIYISIHLFDLGKNLIKTFKSNSFIDELADVYENGQDKVNNVMAHIPKEDYVQEMLTFVDFSTLQERMGDNNSISIVFEGKINGWCRARFVVVERKDDAIERMLFAVECIEAEKKRENYLLYLAGTDLMTDLYNRGHGEKEIIERLRTGKKGVFCLFDVDKFKLVNDNYGHDVGDKVLIAIAECLKKVRQDGDIVMRLGGDEFAAFFADKTKKEVESIIGQLFELISKVSIEPMTEPIRVSLGAVEVRDGMDFDVAYKLADRGVYESKNRKNSSYIFIE